MKKEVAKAMKKIFIALLFVLFTGLQGWTQTIDGTINAGEYGNHTDGHNKQGNVYMKWDDSNLYVGIISSNTAEAAVIYIDKNPLAIINGGTNVDGTLIGNAYDGTNFSALPFRADFVSYFKNGYREYRTANGSNGWSSNTSGFGSYAESGGNVRELSIPWSAMGGKPASFAFFVYLTSSGGWVYNQVPAENASGSIGVSASYSRYFIVDNTSSSYPFANNPIAGQVGWANVQYPATATLIRNSGATTAYMQVYKSGTTNYEGKGSNLQVWLGVNNADTDPSTWSEDKWKAATYYKDAGNNDEYSVVLLGDDYSAGTYYYATRVQYAANAYQYGGYSASSGGFWNGTTNTSGVLTVQDYTGTLFSSTAPAVTSTPSFPTVNDAITINFEASLGNALLKDLAGNVVYAHTGITTPAGDWQSSTTWLQNDAQHLLTWISGNSYSLSIPDIYTYYSVPNTTDIQKMSFVMRNTTGTLQAKTVDNDDFFIPLYAANQLHARFNYPTSSLTVRPGDQIEIQAESNSAEALKLYVDNGLVNTVSGLAMTYTVNCGAVAGSHEIKIVASKAGVSDVEKTISYYITAPTVSEALPAGMKDGINYIDANTVTLVLYAPQKQYVHAIGDFNNWEVNNSCLMKRTPDNSRYWITLTGLVSGQEYGFQYLIDGSLRIADPYTDKVLDPDNDKNISPTIYPDLKPYPTGKTEEIVSVFQTNKTTYSWTVPTFTAPAQNQLVIYELHVRDFTTTGDINGVKNKLDYLKTLGINAIELMPINEFEGNDSWGYNPSFYFAPDKAYGTAQAYKQFIDACHQKGIAVLIDMVLNHSFNQSPMVRMYFDKANDKPAPENPWFNVTAPNTSYSWGSDFNHERQVTKDFVDRINAYWFTEYKIDGIRFDFTKGFTQTIGDGYAYDASRITILKRMYDAIKTVNPNAYVILEHLAANAEEIELANHGIMLWGNMNHGYNEALSGWNESGNSSLSNAYFKNRSFTYANLVSYAESHDEERNPFNALTYGNSTQPTHDVKTKSIYVNRTAMMEAFNLFMPGPRMLWQFEELAYDYSIDYNGRVGRKPIKWEYFDDTDRQSLYTKMAKMIQYRKENPTIFDWKIDYTEDNSCKRIRYIDPNDASKINAIVLGNFGVSTASFEPGFGVGGISWFEAISGTSYGPQTIGNTWSLAPGEFKILIREDAPINYTLHPPLGEDQSITINEDSPKTFGSTDFKFYSVDGKTMSAIKIKSLPGAGSFLYDNASISVDTEISDLTKLTFTPALNANGTGYASFTYQLKDNTTPASMYSEKTYTATINVTAINDAPVITAQQTLTIDKNASLTILLDNLTVTDPDNTYPTGFTLTVADGTNYTHVGNTITPSLDYSGTLTVPVTVNDGTDNSNTFNVQVKVKQSQTITFGPTSATYGDIDFLPATASSGLAVTLSVPVGNTVATIVSNKVHIIGAGQVEVTANQAGDADYSAAPEVIQTLTVNSAPLTITGIGISNKPYDGLTTATITGTAAYAGLQNGETPTVTGTPSASFGTANVANTKPVTVTGYTAPNANYSVSQPTGLTADITAAPLTITGISISNKPYDGLTTATITGTAAYAGLQNGETPAVTGTPSASFATANVANTKPVTVIGYTAPNANYSVSQPTGLTADITAAPLTITGIGISNKPYDGLTTATIAGTAAYSGLQNGETPAVTGTPSASFGTANVANTKPVTVIGYTAPNANYSVSQPTGLTADITASPLTITGIGISNKPYDGLTTATITGTAAYSGLQNGETPAVTGTPSASFGTANVANTKPVTVTGYTAPNSNYSVSQPTGLTADITAAPLTITGISISNKPYDGQTTATITGTAAYSGLQNGETPAVTGTPSASFGTANVANTKPVTVTGYTAPNGNYSVSQPTGLTANITKASQTITFNALVAKTDGDAPFMLVGTASSGLTVSYASSNTAVASVSGNTVTIVGVGTTTITASQSGNTNYNAATDIQQTLTVNMKDERSVQSITFAVLPTKTYGDAAFLLSATASSGLPIVFRSSDTSVATIVGSTVTIVGAGTATITANQSGSWNYYAAPEEKQTLTVNKKDQTIVFDVLTTKIYGDPAFDLSATVGSGLEITYTSSNPLVATVVGKTVSIIGAGTAEITAKQPGNANYSAAPEVKQTLTVNKKDQSITFGVLPTKTNGDPAFDLLATASSGLDVSYLSSNPLVAKTTGKTVTIVGGGTTEITAVQTGNENYKAALEVKQILKVNFATGVEVVETGKIEVYPVPTHDYVTVRLSMDENKPVRYILYSPNGKAVKTEKVTVDNFDIYLKSLPKGIYYLELLSEHYKYIYKVILM